MMFSWSLHWSLDLGEEFTLRHLQVSTSQTCSGPGRGFMVRPIVVPIILWWATSLLAGLMNEADISEIQNSLKDLVGVYSCSKNCTIVTRLPGDRVCHFVCTFKEPGKWSCLNMECLYWCVTCYEWQNWTGDKWRDLQQINHIALTQRMWAVQ